MSSLASGRVATVQVKSLSLLFDACGILFCVDGWRYGSGKGEVPLRWLEMQRVELETGGLSQKTFTMQFC